MLIAMYESKKALKEAIGQSLKYRETSMFGDEYKANGEFAVCNRPSIIRYPGKAREFFATVTMRDGKIAKVS
jgi:hypothetical protein